MLYLTLSTLWLGLAFASEDSTILPRNGYKIPSTSFNSVTDFSKYWAYNYPWGTDHNGGARMSSAQVSVSGGQLTLTAKHVTGQAPTSAGVPINYLSGTVYALETFAVAKTGGYDFTGEFLAPVVKGTWPAFWLTGVNSWPPEIDLAEWKGDGKISFNTFNSTSSIKSLDVAYPNAGSFHEILVQLRDEDGTNVSIKFYLDGKLVTTQYGKGMVGEPFWL
jgi:beta-glucanase (GH16 family)